MSKRIWNCVLATVSLAVGCLLYWIFRPKTYIGGVLDSVIAMDEIRANFNGKQFLFLQFYFPDLLWGMALACCLHAIHSPKLMGGCLCAITTVFYGCIWECLQYCGVLSGTGDVLDVAMYFLGGALCIILNLGGKKNEE